MAAKFLQAKDWVTSKITPDCLKSNIDEVKSKIGGGEKADPDDPANRGKITEWEAGWNVTNAIQVRLCPEATVLLGPIWK